MSHRVEQLADRPEGFQRPHAKAFESLVPLPEVIGASVGYSAASRKVVRQYEEMLRKLGSEFEILRVMPLEEIRSVSGHLITEAVSYTHLPRFCDTPNGSHRNGHMFFDLHR